MATASSHHPLQPEFEKILPPDLARELVRQYVRLKQRARAGDHEGVQEAGGKVAEHALRSAQHLAGARMVGLQSEIRDFPRKALDLEQLPQGSASDALRVVIPRVLTALYTLRNKRHGGHTASEVDPSGADAALTERAADWLLAELFRIGNNLPLDQAQAAVAALMERRDPVVFRAEGYRRVLRTDLSPPEEIMVLLYGEATGATIRELLSWTDIPTTSLRREVDRLETRRLVRTVAEGRTKRVILLPPGERQVERGGLLKPE